MKRSTPILLSIIALALVVIAMNTMGPEAEAQPQVVIAPRLVGISTPGITTVYRAWSDGLVEFQKLNIGTSCNEPSFCPQGWVEVPE